MTRLLAAFKMLSRVAQIVCGLLILFLLFATFYGGQSCGSRARDKEFDKAEAVRAAEREKIESERDAAVGKAIAAEARAKELEGQTLLLELAVEANGKRAEVAQEAIENEGKKLDEEIASIGIDIDSCERVRRLCARLQRLNLYPKDRQCDCQ
jgi:hypothetical protein